MIELREETPSLVYGTVTDENRHFYEDMVERKDPDSKYYFSLLYFI